MPAMQPFELTLIVAATRNMGIGLNGTMPWTGLRKEMQYFARVTSRVSPQAPPNSINAVIMGRKTWDSIPPKFRPLKNRLNIVVSRSPASASSGAADAQQQPVRVSSFEDAVRFAREHPSISRVFVMGGGQIYDAALKSELAKRLLLTSIEKNYECDTFFGLHVEDDRAREQGWTRMGKTELEEWTGQTVGEHGEEEAGVKYEWQMWEKR